MKALPAAMAPQPALIRVTIWLAGSTALYLAVFARRGLSLLNVLSPDWIFGEYHAGPWGVLVLCAGFLWVKRRELWQEMQVNGTWQSPPAAAGGKGMLASVLSLAAGTALVVAAIQVPTSADFYVFQILLGALGVFTVLFGKAVRIPAILLAIYAMAISFPLLVKATLEEPYAAADLNVLQWLSSLTGFPLRIEGQVLTFDTMQGKPITVLLTSDCAGPATMGIYLAIFALMMLDRPQPPGRGAWLFFFGVAGTWLQNLVRVIILLALGHFWGADALWAAHRWTIYILFPLWYLLYAYVYFRVGGMGAGRVTATPELKKEPAAS